jgi:hypothetical protein
MSNMELINISIKINGKAIGVTYEGWIKIHKLFSLVSKNVLWFKNIFECHYYHVFFQ